MASLGISHIGIGVRDLEKSVHFYNKVLGLPIVRKMEYDEMRQLLRHPERPARRSVYFRVGDGPSAVVIVMGTIDGEDRHGPILLDELGIHHFSFWVDDIRALHQRLIDAQVEVTFEPVDVEVYHVDQSEPARGAGPCATMFFRDPDGILLQADQRLARK
jgi:catechol 2,3-dioxygenase-like lactoylglutathione lyase family enzyme